MSFLSDFVGGAATAGADMLQDQRKIELTTAANKSLAEHNSELAMKRERMIEEFKATSANRQREEQVTRIDTAAGKIADTAIAPKRGLINAGITDAAAWTPEQQAAVDQSLAMDKSRVTADPKTRTQAAIATGDISPKDAMADDTRSQVAAAKAEASLSVQSMKNEAYLANVQAKLDMAGDKLEMAKTIATIRASSGGSNSDGKEPANAKMIDYLVKNGTPREQATSMVLGDGTGKTKDPVGLATQLASALIRDGIRVPADAPKGTTQASYAMDTATKQIDTATARLGRDAPKPTPNPGTPATGTPAKPAAPAAATGKARPPLSSFGK